jgi:hypothetical protein
VACEGRRDDEPMSFADAGTDVCADDASSWSQLFAEVALLAG